MAEGNVDLGRAIRKLGAIMASLNRSTSALAMFRVACTTLFTAVLVIAACVSQSWTQETRHVLEIGSALLPVPNTQDERDDPTDFVPAPPDHAIHLSVLCGGWMKEREFNALLNWFREQGFTITRTLEPQPFRTNPSIRFTATIAQINNAFHVTIVKRRNCCVTFNNFRMPARFAQGKEQ